MKSYAGQATLILLLTAILLVLHFLQVEYLVIRPDVDVHESYKEYLLRNTRSPRIVLDGGSSVFHGLDANRVEAETGIPAINLGDDASFATDPKIYRLLKHLHPGDTLVMAVEWARYFRKDPHILFTRGLTEKLAHYYRALPLRERIRYAFYQSPGHLYSAYRQPNRDSWADATYQVSTLFSFPPLHFYTLSGNYPFSDNEVADKMGVSCVDYLFQSPDYVANFGGEFKRTLAAMQALQKQGVTVLATWPAVIGDDCYTARDDIPELMARVKQAYKDYGIPILGEPQDFNYDRRYYFDTYYHLNGEGRRLWTDQLVALISPYLEAIDRAGLVPVKVQVEEALVESRKRLAVKAMAELAPVEVGKLYSMGHDPAILFLDGWSRWEGLRRWSTGKKSLLVLKIPDWENAAGLSITLQGRYFNNHPGSQVMINGRLIGTFRLDGQHPFPIPRKIVQQSQGMLRIELLHHKAVSPFELGQSSDTRDLAFLFESIRLNTY